MTNKTSRKLKSKEQAAKPATTPKKKRGNPLLQKGVQPPWLQEYSFAVRPDHINRSGVSKDTTSLRKAIQKFGNEAVDVVLEDGTTVTLSRFERIIMDWFSSQSFDKQKALVEYGIGKVPDELKVQAKLKFIRVGIDGVFSNLDASDEEEDETEEKPGS